ncbi:high-affinity lysophosphatidic acid receptor-like [Patiria miniata]|uniref:G-protein coupled receptors family 1 profile domain-containing protein n=1 Tax=Patiria miniata TaxID=46514 RepID=A0A914BQ91_PATMI|nr:high-affinity lysophosphatidic acid receptor-like [Patiria miniata]
MRMVLLTETTMSATSSSTGGLTLVVNDTKMTTFPEGTATLPAEQLRLPIGAVAILTIIMVLMILISALGNSIVCLIVYQKPAMRSAINLLLANLAFADIMVALLCMPFALVTLIAGDWLLGPAVCQITAFLYLFFVMEATFILATISVDRYFIIVRRKDKLNPHRAKIVIALSWLSSAIVAFPPIVGWARFEYSPGEVQCRLQYPDGPADKAYIVCLYLAIFYVPCAAMAFSYLFILNTVRRNSLRVQNHPESLSISQANKLGLTNLPRPSRVNVDMSFKTRAFTTILLLFIVFIICWAPSAVGVYVEIFSESNMISPVGQAFILWLTYLNSAFNPIIYCWRIKKFREACRELAPKTFRLLPKLPGRTRRRIRPSAMYECNEQSSV